MDDEEMIDVVVRAMTSLDHDPRNVVRWLVTKWPEAPALQVIYALSIAAGTMEHILSGPIVEKSVQDVWRLAGIIGVDLYMMERLQLPHSTAGDLMNYWLSYDTIFWAPYQ